MEPLHLFCSLSRHFPWHSSCLITPSLLLRHHLNTHLPPQSLNDWDFGPVFLILFNDLAHDFSYGYQLRPIFFSFPTTHCVLTQLNRTNDSSSLPSRVNTRFPSPLCFLVFFRLLPSSDQTPDSASESPDVYTFEFYDCIVCSH